MKDVVFVTGNDKKAEYLSKYLGCPVDHVKLELEEIQSLDITNIVKHKLHQAYDVVRRPVLVEDVSLEFKALGNLPGPFIKWFMESLTLEKLCRLIDGQDRSATTRCVFGYYNGSQEYFFEASLNGRVSDSPKGKGGFGWDALFIPEGFEITRAELSEEDDRRTYIKSKPFDKIKDFLTKNS